VSFRDAARIVFELQASDKKPIMRAFLLHWYDQSELYAFLLVFIVVPLGFYGLYLFLLKCAGDSALPKKDDTNGSH
jgi:hypothetical protein